ncbi:MAG: cell division protein ZapA [Bauldia sp.]
MSQVSVSIAGKVYRMGCNDGEEGHLSALAARLDRDMDRLRREFGVVGEQRLMVMAALKVLDALSDAEATVRRLEAEAASARSAEAAVLRRLQSLDADWADRVNKVADALESAAGRLAAIEGPVAGS